MQCLSTFQPSLSLIKWASLHEPTWVCFSGGSLVIAAVVTSCVWPAQGTRDCAYSTWSNHVRGRSHHRGLPESVSDSALYVLQLGQDTSSSAPDRLITWNNTDFLLWKVSTTNFNGVGAPYVSRRALSSPGKSSRTVPPHHAVCVDGNM